MNDLGRRLTLAEIIELNIKQTIAEFNKSNNCSFECHISIIDQGTDYTNMSFNRVVAPRKEHYLTIKLIEI